MLKDIGLWALLSQMDMIDAIVVLWEDILRLIISAVNPLKGTLREHGLPVYSRHVCM